MNWTEIDPQRLDRDPALSASLRAFIASNESAILDHDPDWLRIQARDDAFSVRLFVCNDEHGAIVGYAPFLEHPARIPFTVLDRSVCSYPVRRLSLTRCVLFDTAKVGSVDASGVLLDLLRGRFSAMEVLFLLGCDYDDPACKRLHSRGPGYIALPFGPLYKRRLIRLPGSLDEYLKLLGANTRQDLRRQERRLLKNCGDAMQCDVYTTAEEVERFLAAAAELSSSTYQARLYGLGLNNDEPTRRRLRAAAEKGWFRGYILRCGGAPAAFMLGYLYRGTYFSADIGYDAKWAEYSVGNVLHLAVIRDLAALDPRPAVFDFMYGDNSNKERLSTGFRTERNMYLFPNSPRWVVVVGALRAFNFITEGAGTWLEKRGVKARIKRFLRRKAVAR